MNKFMAAVFVIFVVFNAQSVFACAPDEGTTKVDILDQADNVVGTLINTFQKEKSQRNLEVKLNKKVGVIRLSIFDYRTNKEVRATSSISTDSSGFLGEFLEGGQTLLIDVNDRDQFTFTVRATRGRGCGAPGQVFN